MLDRAGRFSLPGKRALVTGASRGIGAEIATVFADAGADVAMVGRDAKALDATRQAIAVKGRRCVAIQADLGTVEGPRIAGARAIELLGTVDILVNNAGAFIARACSIPRSNTGRRRRPSISGLHSCSGSSSPQA